MEKKQVHDIKTSMAMSVQITLMTRQMELCLAIH